MISLETTISGKKLYPFWGNAAADYARVFGKGDEVTDFELFSALAKQGLLGFVTTKTLTNEIREGNPEPRFGWIKSDQGIQSMGLPNGSIWNFPFESCSVPTIVSYVGKSKEETGTMTRFLDENAKKNPNIMSVEFNTGCPNVPGCPSCYKEDDIEHLRIVRENTSLPVFVKIGYFPEEDRLIKLGRAMEDIGINGVTAINSPPGMGIDARTGRSLVKKYGGVFGVGLKPLALRTVSILHENTSLEIVGLGGIYGYTDAIEFLRAGATAVQLCSVLNSEIAKDSGGKSIIDIWLPFLKNFKRGIENFMEKEKSLEEIIGKIER